MGKWVLGLCVSLYAVLILFGGEGYDPEKYAEADPEPVVTEEPEVVARASTHVVEETPEIAVVSTTEDTPSTLIEPVETAALQEKVEAVVSDTITSDETRPTLVLQPATDAVTETVSTPGLAEIIAVTESAPQAEDTPVGEIWTVTGSRVNLRSAASTTADILGRTVRGESAEIVEFLDNGWAKVYILETGIEAYMSADFIAPDQG